MKYTFGDSPIATRRLEILNEVFRASSRDFILRAVTNRPKLAVDLGCGPGFSTHLLAETLSPVQTVGLDNSEPFILSAKQSATNRTVFHLHDITHVPFPVQVADIIYCRFLLTHLEWPETILNMWANQLAADGLMLIDEVEWIHTENSVFARYEEIVSAMVADQGGRLYIGPKLETLKTNSLVKRHSQVIRVTAPTSVTANMFSLNIESWKHQPYIRTHFTSDEIEHLMADLKTLEEGNNQSGDIEWGMRQIVFQRV